MQHDVRHDEAKLIRTSKEAAVQLQELFEADGVGPFAGFAIGVNHRCGERGALWLVEEHRIEL